MTVQPGGEAGEGTHSEEEGFAVNEGDSDGIPGS